jgi:hypothetical protein
LKKETIMRKHHATREQFADTLEGRIRRANRCAARRRKFGFVLDGLSVRAV